MKTFPLGLTSVLVVEDDSDARDAIVAAIQDSEDLHCVATASSVDEAFSVTDAFDIALVDLRLGLGSGLSLIGPMRARGSRVLVLTVLGDPAMLESALRLGAEGYLLKDVEPPMLRQAIREVCRGENPVSAKMTHHLIGRLRAAGSSSPLTPRELEVLQVFATGASYADCAHELGLAIGTVQNHVKHIYEKLGASSKSEAVSIATRRGII